MNMILPKTVKFTKHQPKKGLKEIRANNHETSEEKMKTYNEALAVLKNRATKKLARNTYLVRDGKTVHVRLHASNVVSYLPSGAVRVSSGGYRTRTTKDRINSYSPANISQVNGSWYCGAARVPFADNMEFKGGRIAGAARPSDTAKNDRLKKAIKAYASKIHATIMDGTLGEPGAGDCVYCAAKDGYGVTLGDLSKNQDHLLLHMREGYLVPSLVVNALSASKAGDLLISAVFLPVAEAGYLKQVAADAAKRAVTRYLKLRLNIAQ